MKVGILLGVVAAVDVAGRVRPDARRRQGIQDREEPQRRLELRPPAAGFNLVTGATTATTDVHVILNGMTELFVDAINPGNLSAAYYSGSIELKAGDTIDFLVGDGGNGYGNDSTGIMAAITYVPEPSTSTLALIGLGARGRAGRPAAKR